MSPAKPSAKQPSKPAEKKSENNQMLNPHIAKITVNIGVGEAGEKLSKAETVLQNITGQKPVQTLSKTTSKDWALRKRMPIGCKVTLRGAQAHEFLIKALETRENKIAEYSFDDTGNFSFGIPDHTLFKDQKYDPNIGIFGMDVCVTMERPGYRIKHRRLNRRHLPHKTNVVRDESIEMVTKQFNVEVVT